MTIIQTPIPVFVDVDGSPLESGYVYIGTANLNPETNPLAVYWDSAMLQPAAQPLRTSGGMIVRNGTPAVVHVTGNYSVTVRDRRGAIVYNFPDSSNFDNDVALSAQIVAINANFADISNAVDMAKGVSMVGGSGRVIASIAALKTLPKTGVHAAFVLGYYASGDGGGGAYYYDSTDVTSADNNGTIIVANDGGRWKLSHAVSVSVRQFGSVGDDSTNNTTTLQAAINYCSSAGVALYIPPGVYRYDALSLSGAPLSLIGEGRYQSILKTTTTTGACITLSTGGSSITGVKITGIGFTSVSSRTTGATIDFQASTGAFFATELENLWFSSNMSGGISVYGAAFVTMLDNILIDYVASGNQGLRFEGTSRPSSIIADLRLNNIAIRAGAGTGSGIGLQIVDMVDGVYANQVSAEGGLGYGLSIGKSAGGDPIPPRDHWYTQCIFDYSVNIGVYLQSGQNLNFTDCWSSSNSATGVDIGALVVGAKIDGLKSFANALGGIAVQTGADSVQILNSTLVGNSSVSNTYSDIEIKAGVSNFQIKNNMFYRAGATKSSRYNINVVAGASDDYMITGNTCTGYLTAGVFDGGTGVNKVVADNLI